VLPEASRCRSSQGRTGYVPRLLPARRLDGPRRYVFFPSPPALLHVLTSEAATNHNFIREIPMFARFEVRMSIGAWDEKWVRPSCPCGRLLSDYPAVLRPYPFSHSPEEGRQEQGRQEQGRQEQGRQEPETRRQVLCRHHRDARGQRHGHPRAGDACLPRARRRRRSAPAVRGSALAAPARRTRARS
jgi:hypothetical protein